MKQKHQFCDDCLHGILNPASGDLHCRKKLTIYFQAPVNESSRGPSHYAHRGARWGWRPQINPCSLYRTIFQKQGESRFKSIKRKERLNRRRHHGDPTENQKQAIKRLPLDPPHAPVSQLPVRDDVPGIDALTKQYASEIEAGRLIARRLTEDQS